MGYYSEFKAVLDNAKNEQDVCAYLKKKPILIERLRSNWNGKVSAAEFQIGTQYRCDFIVLSARSGNWECLLIELQSPLDKLFTGKNELSKGLREAQRQITDWKAYIDDNKYSFRSQLAFLAKDLPAYCSNANLHQYAKTELIDFNTSIKYRYMTIIGRKSYLSQENNRRRAEFQEFDILTFDHLLDDAKRLDDLLVDV